MRSVPRRLLLIGLMAAVLLSATPRAAEAGPDPVVASLMSAGATAIPLTLSGILLGTGRGADEGIRFDLGMATLGIGVTVGPSVGQIYASGGTDALVLFLLRTVTGAVMTTGVGFRLRGAPNRQTMGMALALTGGVPTGLLALYDIYAASVSATEARYKEGHAQISLPADLIGVARCGPIPCEVGGTDNPMGAVHQLFAVNIPTPALDMPSTHPPEDAWAQ